MNAHRTGRHIALTGPMILSLSRVRSLLILFLVCVWADLAFSEDKVKFDLPKIDLSQSNWAESEEVLVGDLLADEEIDVLDSDRSSIYSQLQEGAFETVCQRIKLKPKLKKEIADFLKIELTPKREIKRDEKGRFAIIDKIGLGLPMELPGIDTSFLDGKLNIGINFRAEIEGESKVIWWTDHKKSCEALLEEIDPRTAKTALVFSPKAISKMSLGEIWKLPIRFTASFSASTGRIDEVAPISFSYSNGSSSESSVSLYRMSEDRLRFRIRLSRISYEGEEIRLHYDKASGGISLFSVGLFGIKYFVKLIDNQLTKPVEKLLRAWFGASVFSREGIDSMVEFILNPNDPQQMEALSQVIGGDLNGLDLLSSMAKQVKEIFKGRDNSIEQVTRIRERHEKILGVPATFSGLREHWARPRHRELFVPVALDIEKTTALSNTIYKMDDGTGAEVHAFGASEQAKHGAIKIPILGTYTKDSSEEGMEVFVQKSNQAQMGRPLIFFLKQFAFIRKNSNELLQDILNINKLVEKIGVRGRGVNPRTRLPVEQLLPEQQRGEWVKVRPSKARNNHHKTNGELVFFSDEFRRGIVTLKLVLSTNGVQELIASNPQEIIRAYHYTLPKSLEKTVVAKFQEIVSWNSKNEPQFDMDVLKKIGEPSDAKKPPADMGRIKRVKKAVESGIQLVKQISAIRSTVNYEEQARLLRNFLAGEDERSLPFGFLEIVAGGKETEIYHSRLFEILLQLVDSSDLKGDFLYTIKKGRTGMRADIHYKMNHEGFSDQKALDVFKSLRSKYNPSDLSD